MTAEDIRIEHRLTKIEALSAATAVDVAEVKALVKEQNGKVARHMEEDAKWMAEHDKGHAYGKGYTAGQMATIGIFVVVGNFAVGIAIKLVLG